MRIVVVGWVFLWSGWHKLQILPRMIGNFRSWRIPAPEMLAPFLSGVEFLGGLLLLLDVLTRFAAAPMMTVVLVAIIAAKSDQIDPLETLFGFEEVSYFAMFAWLANRGPRLDLARPPGAEGLPPLAGCRRSTALTQHPNSSTGKARAAFPRRMSF